ncbi:hypothetical protein A7U60_g980 [Sanghuangporus baumii]|uniref:Uncharacterized protein n=1 Tax=Sanghuangporus baumii TaxID=108892 RepID=A0A9Q5I4W7_SANBA|nr:hypothetical protein A7U60_g980 [Sanghuangporus baumii]
MIVLFRSSFITAAFVCIVAVSQFATVYAAPQIGMRPKLRVLGVDASGSEVSSILSAAATADVDGSASATLSPEITATAASESSTSDDPGTDFSVQSNSAASSASGVGVALLIGSFAALIQTF